MTLADKLSYLNGPQGDGLTSYYRLGVVTLAAVTSYEIWQLYEATRHLPAFADRPHQLVRHIAQECGVHRTTVWRAITMMNQPA